MAGVNPEAPEWKRRRHEHRIAFGASVVAFLSTVGAAIAGKDTPTLQVALYTATGAMLVAAGLRAWTGLSRLKHGKEG